MENATALSSREAHSAEEIQHWMVSYLSNLLRKPADKVDLDLEFEDFGLDSSVVVALSGDLEAWLSRELDPSILFEYTTIRSLSEHLAAERGDLATG